MPRFVIVMPCFNNAEVVGAALESALAQRHDDYSVVVCDNGSRDGSAQIIQRYSSPRLHAHLHADTVPKTENWNRAYEAASDCEYLVTLHADDQLDPLALRHIDAAREDDPALIFGPARHMAVDGTVRRSFKFPIGHRTAELSSRRMLLLGNVVSVVGVAMRRRDFHELGGWPPEWVFLQDMEMWWRLAARGDWVFVRRVLGNYRDNPSVPGRPSRFPVEALDWYMAKFHAERSGPLAREVLIALAAMLARVVNQGGESHPELPGRIEAARALLPDDYERIARSAHARQLMLRLMAALTPAR